MRFFGWICLIWLPLGDAVLWQDLLESAQNLSHRDYIVYKNKVIEMFDADGYSK